MWCAPSNYRSNSELRRESRRGEQGILFECTALVRRSHPARSFDQEGTAAQAQRGVYLHLKLADRTGEIDGRAWDRPEEIAHTVDCNAVVKIRGNIEACNEKPQLVVSWRSGLLEHIVSMCEYAVLLSNG